jgi:hypothetical protein
MNLSNEGKITAPWTPEQVAALNRYQHSGWHPFTCPCSSEPHEFVLFATSDGWICKGCNYTQNWAWDYMAEDIPSPQKVIEGL